MSTKLAVGQSLFNFCIGKIHTHHDRAREVGHGFDIFASECLRRVSAEVGYRPSVHPRSYLAHLDALAERARSALLPSAETLFFRERRGESVKDERKPRVLTEKFFRAYLSPVGQLGADAYTGEDFDGNEFGGKEWKPGAMKFGELDRLMPFAVKEMRDAYHKAGAVGAVKSTPAFAGVGVNTREKQSEPIMPSLSEPVRDELDRLGLDLNHLGKDGKKSASINPRYQTEGITGDSIRPFGGTTGKPGREVSGMGVNAEETARALSAELEEVLGEIIKSPDYQAFESDEDRAQHLEMIVVNVHKRVMNGVRVDGRGAEMEAEKRVTERLNRMSAPTSGVKNLKL